MRLLFTLHNFFPEQIYGAEKVCILQMRELLKRGHTVGLFYAGNVPPSRDQLQESRIDKAEFFRVPFINTKTQVLLSAWNPHVSKLFKQTIRQFRPDVVIFHHLVRLSLDLPLVADDEHIPTICYLHDFYLVCPLYSLLKHDGKLCSKPSMAGCSECLVKTGMAQFQWHRLSKALVPLLRLLTIPFLSIRNRLISSFSKRIALFISPSTFLVHQLKDAGIRLQRSVIIPNGVDAVQNRIPQTLHHPIRFGYMGNILKKKGIDVLVKAFQGRLANHLTIRGFPDTDAILRFKQRYPDFNADLELFNPDIDSFFNKIDAVIVPSIWVENQPTVIIEAFQFGKPVICSDIGGMKEMISGNRGGVLFKTGDSQDLKRLVEQFIQQPHHLSHLAASIPRWITVEDMVNRVESAIHSVNTATLI